MRNIEPILLTITMLTFTGLVAKDRIKENLEHTATLNRLHAVANQAVSNRNKVIEDFLGTNYRRPMSIETTVSMPVLYRHECYVSQDIIMAGVNVGEWLHIKDLGIFLVRDVVKGKGRRYVKILGEYGQEERHEYETTAKWL